MLVEDKIEINFNNVLTDIVSGYYENIHVSDFDLPPILFRQSHECEQDLFSYETDRCINNLKLKKKIFMILVIIKW